MVSLTVRDELELEHAAHGVLQFLMEDPQKHVITLKGDLGAGKTAFTKALARVLEVREDITSPTFVIMKSYPLTHERFETLRHIDAYRVDDEEELVVLGITNLFTDPRELIVIEWPERILGLLPKNALAVSITITHGSDRLITYGE